VVSGKNVKKWTYDHFASSTYNLVGALERTLINLEIIEESAQWGIEDIDRYCLDLSIQEGIRAIYKEEVDGFRFRDDYGRFRITEQEFNERVGRIKDFSVKFTRRDTDK
jgi:hypothetical protein